MREVLDAEGLSVTGASPDPAPDLDRNGLSIGESQHGGGGYVARGITLARGAGARLEDGEGKSYVDCVSGHGAAVLGHAHPSLTQALADQASTLMSCPTSFGSETRGQLLELLAEVTGLQRFFLCNSGTEAVEAAIKYARLQTGRARIVATMRGFHGRTLGALSLTWDRRYRRPFEPLIPDVTHIPFDSLDAAEAALGDDVAALVVEPIQGEGGVRIPDDDYLPGLQRLCRQHGALLILDEVQTGFGRTGRWFAYQHALGQGAGRSNAGADTGADTDTNTNTGANTDEPPDLIALGKAIAGGVPMGALAIREGLPAFATGTHGSTFGGNPLACAASLATLRALAAEDLIDRSRRLGEQALEVLHEGLKGCEGVREIRGRGLMIGIELRERSGPLLRALSHEGILALAAGPTVIRLLPPLVIDAGEWQWTLERVVELIVARQGNAEEAAS